MKYGKLTVIKINENKIADCLCDCGNKTSALLSSIKSGHKQSCGCLRRERVMQSNTKHGATLGGVKMAEYRVWCAMKSRCNDKYNSAYQNYGGRGIKVCKRWERSFSNFLKDMGKKPPGGCIERIDNNDGYRPGNCKWISFAEQQNNKRTNVFLTYNGQTKTQKQWADEAGLNYKTFSQRVQRHGIEKAMTMPIRLDVCYGSGLYSNIERVAVGKDKNYRTRWKYNLTHGNRPEPKKNS